MWWVPKKRVHIQNRGVITLEGVKTSKNRSVGPRTVQYDRVIILEGCSLTGVSLYFHIDNVLTTCKRT